MFSAGIKELELHGELNNNDSWLEIIKYTKSFSIICSMDRDGDINEEMFYIDTKEKYLKLKQTIERMGKELGYE